MNGAADDDGSFPYGRDVWVTCVREQDGRVGAMHDELQRDVVLQFICRRNVRSQTSCHTATVDCILWTLAVPDFTSNGRIQTNTSIGEPAFSLILP